MTDTSLDVLLDAVRLLIVVTRFHFKDDLSAADHLDKQYLKVDALIKQRTGRPDDQPAAPKQVADYRRMAACLKFCQGVSTGTLNENRDQALVELADKGEVQNECRQSATIRLPRTIIRLPLWRYPRRRLVRASDMLGL